MPLTQMQKRVMESLSKMRSPESHVAGGVLVNRGDDSPRFSSDIDFFHDRGDIVRDRADADTALLCNEGYRIDWQVRQPTLCRADVFLSGEMLRLEWCNDSAFRFFPIQADPVFGYCLHPADAATNKTFAASGRSEIRDFIDLLFIHDTYLHLGVVMWAACGKDQGFTPSTLLYHAKRNMRFREQDLTNEKLALAIDLRDLKSRWLAAADSAEDLISRLPPTEIGCLYLDSAGKPITPDPAAPGFRRLIRHFGSIGGSLPSVMNIPTSESR